MSNQEPVASTEQAPQRPIERGNVYQRKVAVMQKCATVKPDSEYADRTGKVLYKYMGITEVSDGVRPLLVEAGLDVEVDFGPMPGFARCSYVNVDDPQDRIDTHWPIVEGDKLFALTTKQWLIRSLLLGDGEEGDVNEMAKKSSESATALSKKDIHAPSGGPTTESVPLPSTWTSTQSSEPDTRNGVRLPVRARAVPQLADAREKAMALFWKQYATFSEGEEASTENDAEQWADSYLAKLAESNFKKPFAKLNPSEAEGIYTLLNSKLRDAKS